MERVCCQLPLFAWCDRRVRFTKSDNGRFSLRVANTFSLETTSIKLKNNGCLCRRRRFAGRVLVKSRYDTVACLLSYSR
jgi:hypothetical protein